MKRLLTILLAICLLIPTCPTAFAAQAEGFGLSDTAAADHRIEISAEGNNTIGALLADTITESQDKPSNGENAILDVKVKDDTAYVSVLSNNKCRVAVALYQEDGLKMITSYLSDDLEPGEQTVQIALGKDIPMYYYLRAFLLAEDNTPLCKAYESNHYTKVFLDCMAKTVDDFEGSSVVNFDNDDTTNFAVYSDDVTELNTKSANILSAHEGNTYTFTNIDDTLKTLKPGDKFTFTGTDGNTVVIKASAVDLSENTAVITASDSTTADEFFSYIKIDTVSEGDSAYADMSTADEGVELIERGLAPTGKIHEGTVARSLDFRYELGPVHAMFEVSLTAKIRVLIADPIFEIDLTIDNKDELAVEIEGKVSAEPTLGEIIMPTPIAGVSVRVELKFVFEASAKLITTTSLGSTAGFAYNSVTGFKDLSTPIDFSGEVNVEGEFFLGVKLIGGVQFLDELISTSVAIKAGAKVTAKQEIWNVQGSDPNHPCPLCISGEVFGVGELSAELEAKLMYIKASLKYTFADFSQKLFDFYYSSDLGFGKGICPNIKKQYLLTVCVHDSNKPVAAADVNGSITDASGRTSFTVPQGELKLTVSAQGYITDTRTVEVKGDGRLDIYLKRRNTTAHTIKTNDISTEGEVTHKKYHDTVVYSGSGVAQLSFKFNDYSGEEKPEEPDNVCNTMVIGDGITEVYGDSSFRNRFSGNTEISDLYWEWYSTALINNLVIGNGVQTICDDTFYGLGIKSITLGSGMKYIGSSAFDSCLMDNIVIPEGVEYIGSHAFANCTNLKSITIPDSVTYLGYGAFQNCTALEKIQIGSGLVQIDHETFAGCKALTDIEIPNNIKTISINLHNESDDVHDDGLYYGAFENCTSLVNVTISDGAQVIGERAFRNCTSLKNINFPNSLTRINNAAFNGCKSLKSIRFGNQMEYLGEQGERYGVFGNCVSLTNVELGDHIKGIGEKAFSGCSALKRISIPNSVETIGELTFSNCSALEQVHLSDNLNELKTGTFYGCVSLRNINIPKKSESIKPSLFSGCSSLTDVYIPTNITAIEEYAFQDCTGLTRIVIPEKVTEIKYNAFSGCSRLADLTLPDSLEYIGNNAFSDTALTSVSVPPKTNLGENAFPVTVAVIRRTAVAGTGAKQDQIAVTGESRPLTDGEVITSDGFVPESPCLLAIVRIGDDGSLQSAYYLAQTISDTNGGVSFKVHGNYPDAEYWYPIIYGRCAHKDTHEKTLIEPKPGADGLKGVICNRCDSVLETTTLDALPVEAEVILGDADGDGDVSILDATAIQRTLAKLSTKSYVEAAADADGDTEITINDATAIQRYIAQLPAPNGIGKTKV